MTFDEAYPIDKQINTEKFLRNVWNGSEKTAYSAYYSEPLYRQLDNIEEIISKATENILRSSVLPGYNIPRFIADFGTVSIPSYWGGQKYKPLGGCIGIKPVIENSKDVKKIRPLEPGSGDAEKAAHIWSAVSFNLQTDRLHCTFIDIQGPLNTAALLWQQEDFLVAMLTEPEIVHELLEQVTEHIIQTIKAMIQKIRLISGPMWPFIYLPPDIGVGITEDYMPLISPELYKEFGIPYLERISQVFGGIFIHCCGRYAHHIDNLKKSRINILGMEFHYPYTMPETLFQAFGSSAIFVPMLGPHGREKFQDTADYFLYLKDIRLKETRLWLILTPEEKDFGKQVEIVDSMM